MQEKLRPNQEINKLIDSAIRTGYKIAVATSSTRKRAEKILNLLEIKDKLNILVTAEEVEKHKPNPDIFLKTAEELNIEPKDCIVFEDAVNGIQAAKKAGMRSIAVLTEYTKKEDFENMADLVIKDFSEVDIGLLERL